MPRRPKIVAEGFEEFAANSAKWDFSKASLKANGIDSDAMLMECWAYEFSRENEELVKAIESWRASLIKNRTWKQSSKKGSSPQKRNLSFEMLKQACAGSDILQVESEIEGTSPWYIRVPFRAIYFLCPEWPEKSFLEIPLEKRARRIRSMGKEYPWYLADPNWSRGVYDIPKSFEADPRYLGLRDIASWNSFFEQLMKSAASENKLRAFSEDEIVGFRRESGGSELRPEDLIRAKAECVVFHIRWAYPNKAYLSWFEKWLNENRPSSEDSPKLPGTAKTGKTPLQNMAKRLEMLGKWRLVMKNGKKLSTQHPDTGELLFRDQWRWDQTHEVILRERRQFGPTVIGKSG